ncbi:dTMP kinase [Carnobacterium viridans]|uniref:Thymidylate kinase n=1 Tax=Carnobacterium viridans TaxID=174587 RepID=A0A1H1AFU9_9LACT|nr:dTMP kinase [Carnobacterium viridans]UDE96209.1 dTMP kinase [Carnobacterium viridans]SDQ38519.1 dTMP kinase [Carnobacterium viridans]
MKGTFITIEGPDGAGKTSVIKKLIPMLVQAVQQEIVATREPGGSRIAEEIRELILNPTNTEMDIRTEALLYAAGRRQHLVEKIIPALKAGKVVVCDRFVDSSLAYQGVARGIGTSEVAEINQFATENLSPDLTLYLDIEAHAGLERINQNKNNRQFDRLDQETLEFHEKVRSAYLTIAKEQSERIVQIDASQDLETVVEQCYHVIIEKLRV